MIVHVVHIRTITVSVQIGREIFDVLKVVIPHAEHANEGVRIGRFDRLIRGFEDGTVVVGIAALQARWITFYIVAIIFLVTNFKGIDGTMPVLTIVACVNPCGRWGDVFGIC